MKTVIFLLSFALVLTSVFAYAADSSQCAACACPRCKSCAKTCDSFLKSNAAKEPAGNGAVRKLGRGLANLLFGFPSEIYNQMAKANVNGGPVAAMTWGLASGVGMAGVRSVVGLYEFATFPIPIPPGYEPILDDPELFFRDQDF